MYTPNTVLEDIFDPSNVGIVRVENGIDTKDG